MIIDTHAHYDDESFDIDRDDLLTGMKGRGVERIVTVGADIATSKAAIELTKKYPFVYGAIGVHPSDVTELDEEKIAWLLEMSREDKIVAIGEIGLDYHYDEPLPEIQKKWFIRQLALAREAGLPVIIHSRDAAEDTLQIMQENHAEELGGVVHCFSYSLEMAKEYVKMGFYIGLGGVCTFKNAKKVKKVAAEIPLEKIVLETDCPYLAPEPNRGKRNDSANLIYVAREIAALRGISEEEVIRQTRDNACRLYHMN